MSRITLLGMESQRKAIIAGLMDIGAVEVSVIDPGEYGNYVHNPYSQTEASEVESMLADVRSALASLEKYCPVKRGVLNFNERREITLSEFNKILESKEIILEAAAKIKKQEERLVQLKAEENRLNNLYSALLPWKTLDVPLETTGTRKSAFIMGTIPTTVDWDGLKPELPEKLPLAVINKINGDKDQHYVAVVCYKDAEQECMAHLKQLGFNRVIFQGTEGTVAENFAAIERRLRELSEERETSIKLIKEQEPSRASLETLCDALGMELDRIAAMRKIVKTERVFLLQGWVPERISERVKEHIESKFVAHVDIREPGDDEEFPVLLENNAFAEAGEPVTAMYGLPNCREIDPNAVMTPFFIMFFGLMFSDGGYGLIMAIVAGLALWKLNLRKSTRKFVKLLFFCGISTVFWGAMFGGWFGISFLTKYAVWFDAASDPEMMLSWSLLFGIIHIYAGLGLKAANMIRRKQYLDALLDVGIWYVVFTGFAMFLLPYVPRVDPAWAAPISNAGKYIMGAGVVLVILTYGRGKKNIFVKIFGGFARLYDIISFFSDVLSYSRLMALGLATSIIASIVNELAFMFELPLVPKLLAASVILAAGHAIDFAINALGAYVHSCRLQYLEFFGKFYEGGGNAFEPLRVDTQYVAVKPDSTA